MKLQAALFLACASGWYPRHTTPISRLDKALWMGRQRGSVLGRVLAGDEPGKVVQTIRIETDLDEALPELATFAVVK